MVAYVCRKCQRTAQERPCEHCGGKKRQYKDTRESAAKRGYGRRWRGWRTQVMRRLRATGQWNGRCDDCGKMIYGQVHVDHIAPVQSSDDVNFYKRENVQFLHPSCHSKKTAKDRARGATR